MAHLTLINLNMLFMRYGEEVEREKHVPLGCLYLSRALENAGYDVDFRDYQLCPGNDPFDMKVFLDFVKDPAPVIGLSCMANLLPFTIQALKALREHYPDRVLVLGGVGAKAVEEQILTRFPWIDIICRGEGERSVPQLMAALSRDRDLSKIHGLSYRDPLGSIQSAIRNRRSKILHNPDCDRIEDLDSIPFPAFEKIDLRQYAGYGMMTSRGCPYPCTFCSVAPVWNLKSYSRGAPNIVAEMKYLHDKAGVDMFLFQDEFFVSGKRQVMDFCRELKSTGLKVAWKAFGRVNLTDVEMMQAMADTGCVELRFGIESGSDRILKRVRKGFTSAETLELIPKAVKIFPRTDAFFVWGFPFETMEDFNQSLFQMVSFRMLGARILPSLLSLLPQTEIYRECVREYTLEFCPYLLPEFVFTGHEICRGGDIEIPDRYKGYFEFILQHPDIFPGFYHVNLKENVLPKLELLREFGFYPAPQKPAEEESAELLAGALTAAHGETGKESCGAHSPRLTPQEIATRAGKS